MKGPKGVVGFCEHFPIVTAVDKEAEQSGHNKTAVFSETIYYCTLVWMAKLRRTSYRGKEGPWGMFSLPGVNINYLRSV